jgi:hypothetical protein
MGKESKLRNNYKPGETRREYSNGDRKFYDRDACPAGMDEYVWQLTLYFEHKLEEFGVTGDSKRPIVYTEIYHKISSDQDLTSLLDRDTIHSTSTKESSVVTYPHATALKFPCPRCKAEVGENCRGARETRNGVPWRRTSVHMERHQAAHKGVLRGEVSFNVVKDTYSLIEGIIDYYFEYYEDDKQPNINSFINSFNDIKCSLYTKDYYNNLKTSGTKVPVITTGTPQPDKRTKEDQEILDITVNRVYTESDMREMFDKFKGGQSTLI